MQWHERPWSGAAAAEGEEGDEGCGERQEAKGGFHGKAQGVGTECCGTQSGWRAVVLANGGFGSVSLSLRVVGWRGEWEGNSDGAMT